VLLSDPKTAAFITSKFVPVWETIRPAPRVTIDFGDGRTMTRTLKGSTCMYVVLPDGRVVDALPGVYTPEDFKMLASQSLEFLNGRLSPDLSVSVSDQEILAWHRGQVRDVAQNEQMRVSTSKAVMESPLLKALGVPPAVDAPAANYGTVFDRYAGRLEDLSSRPMSGRRVKVEAGGQNVVAIDSQVNVRYVRMAVHLMFAGGDKAPRPAECRTAMFKKILHIDPDDPNLGLTAETIPGTP